MAQVISQALDALQAARAKEGRAMAAELIALGRSISDHLGRIADRAPMVVQAYHKRLTDRIQALVLDQGVTVEPVTWSGRSRSSPIVAISARKSFGFARTWPSTWRSSRSPRARAGSWSSSCRRWAGRSTRSARRLTTSRSAARWWTSRRSWKRFVSSFKMWNDEKKRLGPATSRAVGGDQRPCRVRGRDAGPAPARSLRSAC